MRASTGAIRDPRAKPRPKNAPSRRADGKLQPKIANANPKEYAVVTAGWLNKLKADFRADHHPASGDHPGDRRGGANVGLKPSQGGGRYGLRFSPKCQTPTQIFRKRWNAVKKGIQVHTVRFRGWGGGGVWGEKIRVGVWHLGEKRSP